MKYLIVLCLLLSGCATVSEYNQGCRDGIGLLPENWNGGPMSEPDMVNHYCNSIERKREAINRSKHDRPIHDNR